MRALPVFRPRTVSRGNGTNWDAQAKEAGDERVEDENVEGDMRRLDRIAGHSGFDVGFHDNGRG